jgi:phage-related protein
MSTPVFVWTPSWQTQEQSEPRTRLAELAEVISLGSDGTNADLKTWSVVLENRFHDEAMAIDLFLASRRGVEAFAWNNPRSLVKLYVCEQWDSVVIANRAGGNAAADRIWTITATFREVIGVVESLICWYQRSVNLELTTSVYSSVVDNNANMYIAYFHGANRYPSVYKISNDLAEIWGKHYSLDPALSGLVASDFGKSYYLLDTGTNHIDFLAWQWSVNSDYPIRIYRFRISKQDGSIISVVATDWAGGGSAVNFNIDQVKTDSSGNYYFVAIFNEGSEVRRTSIIKFSASLEFVWCKLIANVDYVSVSGACNLVASRSNPICSLTVADSGVIGCAASETQFATFATSYFSLSFDGTILSSFLPKIKIPSSTVTDSSVEYIFQPRSVCRDGQGNIYGMGSYNPSGPMFNSQPLVVYKDSPDDTTIWAKDIRSAIFPRGGISDRVNQLLAVGGKLVFAAGFVVGAGSQLLICVFNTTTGQMEKSIDFNCPQSIGDLVMIQPLPTSGKFIIQTQAGYRLRFDVNNLPADGSYPTTDGTTQAYTVTSNPTTTEDHTFYRFTECGPISFVNRDLTGFSPVTPVVSVDTATGGFFRDFACQDS